MSISSSALPLVLALGAWMFQFAIFLAHACLGRLLALSFRFVHTDLGLPVPTLWLSFHHKEVMEVRGRQFRTFFFLLVHIKSKEELYRAWLKIGRKEPTDSPGDTNRDKVPTHSSCRDTSPSNSPLAISVILFP